MSWGSSYGFWGEIKCEAKDVWIWWSNCEKIRNEGRKIKGVVCGGKSDECLVFYSPWTAPSAVKKVKKKDFDVKEDGGKG